MYDCCLIEGKGKCKIEEKNEKDNIFGVTVDAFKSKQNASFSRKNILKWVSTCQ